MAVEDYGGKVLGKPIEVIHADHQNKPDVGSNIARQWFDTGGVDLVQDLANSAVALAVAAIAKEKKRHIVVNGSSNMGITNQACSPYAVHYAYDAYSLAHGTGPCRRRARRGQLVLPHRRLRLRARAREAGVRRGDGRGGPGPRLVRHPLNTTDFSSFLLQAQASGAKIIGVASPAPTPPTRSRARRSSGSPRSRSSRRCCSGSTTSTRSGSMRRAAFSSPTPGTGT